VTADPARAQAVFLAASALADAAARAACLDAECAGDAALRARVESLLRAHDQADSLLDVPFVGPPSGETQTLPADARPDAAADTRTLPTPVEDDPGDVLAFRDPPGRPDSLGRIGH